MLYYILPPLVSYEYLPYGRGFPDTPWRRLANRQEAPTTAEFRISRAMTHSSSVRGPLQSPLMVDYKVDLPLMSAMDVDNPSDGSNVTQALGAISLRIK